MGSLVFDLAVERPFSTDVQALANRFLRLDIFWSCKVLACVFARILLLERIKSTSTMIPIFLSLRT